MSLRCKYCQYTSLSVNAIRKHSLSKHGASWNPPNKIEQSFINIVERLDILDPPKKAVRSWKQK